MVVRSGLTIPSQSALTPQLLGCTWVDLLERKTETEGAVVVVDTGEEEVEVTEMRVGAMKEEGIGTRGEGMIGAMEEIGMEVTEGIDMAVIGMVEVSEGGKDMVEVTDMRRTGMVEEDPGDRDLPVPTTGSRDQGGIIGLEAGAMSDQDTENLEDLRTGKENK